MSTIKPQHDDRSLCPTCNWYNTSDPHQSYCGVAGPTCTVCGDRDGLHFCGECGRPANLRKSYEQAKDLAKSQEETIKKLMDEQDALWGALANGVLLPHMKRTSLVEAVLDTRRIMSSRMDHNAKLEQILQLVHKLTVNALDSWKHSPGNSDVYGRLIGIRDLTGGPDIHTLPCLYCEPGDPCDLHRKQVKDVR